jgi:hypothetical protein
MTKPRWPVELGSPTGGPDVRAAVEAELRGLAHYLREQAAQGLAEDYLGHVEAAAEQHRVAEFLDRRADRWHGD